MSSFASDLLSSLGEATERGGQALVRKAESSPTGRTALNMLGNKGWEFGLSEEGKAIGAMDAEYIRLHDISLGREQQKLDAIRQWHQGDDAARNNLPIKTATIRQYHKAIPAGHPAKTAAQDIINAGNGDLTQKALMIKNEQIARLEAIQGSYGDKFQNATPLIAKLRSSANPNLVDHGQRLADIVSNQVRDTKKIYAHVGSYTEQSASKVAMNKAFVSSNKVLELLDEPKINLLDTEKTYTKPEEWERKAHRVLNTQLIPYVALPHIGQLFNLVLSSPLPAIGATLLRMNHDEMEQTVEASGILASTMWRTTYEDILGETGKVSNWTNSPTLGKILSRTIHQPGFNWLRKMQLNAAGAVGFNSTIYWAHNFAESGSEIAEARLREMELDPAQILAQKGKLTAEQLQKGVYHFTNNRMFFNKSIDNSLWQNRNPFTRAIFMYHSFVNSQFSFMRRELLLMAKAGDFKGLAQAAGTLFILFPNFAPLISGAEILARTGSPAQAGAEIKQRYKRFYHLTGVGDWLENYTAILSHLGTWGVYFNYINAIRANRLASAAAGPLIGASLQDASDLVHAGFMPSKSGKHNWKSVERDALKQGIPVLGSPLAHTLVPTKAEEKLEGKNTSVFKSSFSGHLHLRGGRGGRRRSR